MWNVKTTVDRVTTIANKSVGLLESFQKHLYDTPGIQALQRGTVRDDHSGNSTHLEDDLNIALR
jgi:hypothetical protein